MKRTHPFLLKAHVLRDLLSWCVARYLLGIRSNRRVQRHDDKILCVPRETSVFGIRTRVLFEPPYVAPLLCDMHPENTPIGRIQEDLRTPPSAIASCGTSPSLFNRSGGIVLFTRCALLVLYGLNARPQMKPFRTLLAVSLTLLLSLCIHGNRNSPFAEAALGIRGIGGRTFQDADQESALTKTPAARSMYSEAGTTQKGAKTTHITAESSDLKAGSLNIGVESNDLMPGLMNILAGTNDMNPRSIDTAAALDNMTLKATNLAAEPNDIATGSSHSAATSNRSATRSHRVIPELTVATPATKTFGRSTTGTAPCGPACVQPYRGGPRPRPPSQALPAYDRRFFQRTITNRARCSPTHLHTQGLRAAPKNNQTKWQHSQRTSLGSTPPNWWTRANL